MPIMSTSTKANDVIILLSDDEEESESTLVPNNTPISTPRYRNSSFLGEISIFDYNSNHSTTGNGIKKNTVLIMEINGETGYLSTLRRVSSMQKSYKEDVPKKELEIIHEVEEKDPFYLDDDSFDDDDIELIKPLHPSPILGFGVKQSQPKKFIVVQVNENNDKLSNRDEKVINKDINKLNLVNKKLEENICQKEDKALQRGRNSDIIAIVHNEIAGDTIIKKEETTVVTCNNDKGRKRNFFRSVFQSVFANCFTIRRERSNVNKAIIRHQYAIFDEEDELVRSV
uniref:Uncharacterized protein n=1 Tax=Parastrongyloides trichosuri TaxID=131310 RepID=A0A0N4ZBM0_PARTI